jgi:hypothetical protein
MDKREAADLMRKEERENALMESAIDPDTRCSECLFPREAGAPGRLCADCAARDDAGAEDDYRYEIERDRKAGF